MKKTLRISFAGKTYEVVAELLDDDGGTVRGPSAPATAAAGIAAAAPGPARPAVAGAGEITSPLAGKVVSIDAKPGVTVKAGQGIITLEAMKMNTIVSTTVDGTVATVHVNPGDAVEEGQLLMSLK